MRKFTYPNGRRRTFAPWKWEWRDRILVTGEFLAFGVAIAAIPAELLKWGYAPWLIVAAALVGTSALLWYAFDLVSAGEAPLTNQSAHKIKQVVSALEMEKQGAFFDWESINENGGIPMDLSKWSGLRPDLKAIMEKCEVPLMVAVELARIKETDALSEDN